MSIRNCRQLRRRQGIVVTILVGKAIGKAIERSPVTSATSVLSDAPQNQEELESEFRGVATSRGENVVKSALFCLELACNPR